MNRELAMKVANAVLYEGYMLYPYRPSAIKNRQRWTFGILYPPAYYEVGAGTERSQMHSECLVKLNGDLRLHVQLRFLQLMTRHAANPAESGDEGVERNVDFEAVLPQTAGTPVSPCFGFTFPASLDEPGGNDAEAPKRGGRVLSGTASVTVTNLRDNVAKLTIDITNTSSLAGDPHDRDSALLDSLLSAHAILTVSGGEFVSLLDPHEDLRQAASECRNVGNFPVLVGTEGERDMLLCSPIVLYDYPQIAPESAGDFFDGTEMDEMLTLRVMTLTDDEKKAMRAADDHVRELLERTETSAREQLVRTHGTIRSMRPVNEP